MKNYIKGFKQFWVNESEWNDELGPLPDAVAHNDLKAVKTLLSSGANPNIKDAHGMSALEIAVLNGNYEIVELLVSHGAKPDAIDSKAFLEQELMQQGATSFFAAINTFEDDELLGVFTTYDDAFNYCRKFVPREMIRSLKSEGFGSTEEVMEYCIDSVNMIHEVDDIKYLMDETSSPASVILKAIMDSDLDDEAKSRFSVNLRRIEKTNNLFKR